MFIKQYSWVEISKRAFDHNIRTYKSILPQNCQLAVVIKSNAYGHDTLIAAKLCQEHSYVDWICINSLSEALLIRNEEFTKPILVMNLIDDDPALAIRNNIDLIGYNFSTIQQFNLIAQQLQQPVYIHLKVDTGMSRLGFLPNELLSTIDSIIRLSHVRIRGIFSHFAESSSADLRYTHYQAEQFQLIITTLKQRGIDIPLRHIANSAASSTIPLKKANMVRLGAGPFGLYPSYANILLTQKKHKIFQLRPILTWKARITVLKKVAAHNFVGYGRTYKTERKTTIGYLPVGYYEGFDKSLSNRALIWLPKQQHYAPVIGMICMNLTMIDLSDVKATQGDEVVLIGPHKQISPETIAQMVGTTNLREVTNRIVAAIPRIIVP